MNLKENQMLLEDYIESIIKQVTSALSSLDKEYTDWDVNIANITARGVLKPVVIKNSQGKEERKVIIDIDEPSKITAATIADIPISFRRKRPNV